ncbi:MAG: acyl-CoA dehydrogenase C-terminal domain-containing protein [Acidimicrobiales bacterium]|nr:acyl-CoA dehydrogenase C-terminal domain-containing protein [Acidimicrobiales bacterium]
MAEYRPPMRDIFFTLDQLVDLDELCQFEAFSHTDPETIKGVLEENGRFVSEVIAPLNRVGDVQGSVHDPATNSVRTPEGFKEAYGQYVDAGWGSVPFPTEYGGGGFPWLMGIAMQEVISSANMAFSMAPLLTQGAIDLLMHHGSEEQKELYVRKMVSGEWTGTMNLTEPQAGSDVGAVKTRAVRQDDGTYRITGTKIFITFGDHDMAENIVHLVLARTPDAPAGTKGISCFVVPKYLLNEDGSPGARNDAYCVSIEHKMGIKASPTCVMSYGDGDGAVGYLIGEENQGMRYMFTMMNNARLSVGLEGLALAERAYQDALEYAQERRQGRAPGAPAGEMSPIIDHPDVRRMLLTMKSLVEAMRAIIYVNAEAIDIATYHPDPVIREAKKEFADILTPVSKGWCTDMGVEVTSLAIQVWGGMGYIEESGVAQHFRDARITPIYEGTNGIQAMDLVGRKLGLRGGEAIKEYLAMIAMLDPALIRAGDDLASVHSHLAEALTLLADTTNWMMHHGIQDPRDALAGATPYLRMFSLVTAGWLMAKQALVAHQALADGTGDADANQAKLTTARFFCEQILPQVHGLAAPVTAGHAPLYELSAAQLAG